MNITLFERNVGKSYSIEKISENIIKHLSKKDKIKLFKPKLKKQSILSIIQNLIEARKNQSAINHITGDIHYIALALNKNKTIITMHDCERLMSNDFNSLKRWIYKLFWFTLPNLNCKYITTVSEESKKNLINYAKIKKEKIKVIPNGVSNTFKQIKLTKKEKENILQTKKPTILHISDKKKNKNFTRILKAIKDRDIKLIKIGQIRQIDKKFIESNNIDFSQIEDISEEMLVKIYNSVDCLVFPSLIEGFGLPIIEAQKCGCPVITSNIGALAETAGKGAILIDPKSIKEIREAIGKILKNKKLKLTITKKGLENINRFKWNQIANKYYELYQIVLQKN